jgi:hypothetical protein
MPDERGITRYEVMPIPPVESQTTCFDAGAVVIGVEYRLLDEAIAAASRTVAARGSDAGQTTGIDDRGVSIHVFGVRDGERQEHLRFDCFDEDPHYHYVSWRDHTNEMIHIDPVADGDPLEWALARLRTRLPQMLARAGAEDVARALEPSRLEAILPRVTEAAYRARFEHDDEAVRRAALAGDAA